MVTMGIMDRKGITVPEVEGVEVCIQSGIRVKVISMVTRGIDDVIDNISDDGSMYIMCKLISQSIHTFHSELANCHCVNW